jgi:3-oxoacyl-[acyl-carrier protein] reductase
MTKTFAAALAPHSITVNAVSPGIIDTDFLEGVPGIEGFFPRIPLGQKPGEATDVAKAIAFLASDDARYITGEILDVNGGLLMD